MIHRAEHSESPAVSQAASLSPSYHVRRLTATQLQLEGGKS